MDFLPTLPPELAALADPAARGAAPLLAPVDPEDAAALGATPFALALALLTNPSPSGEALPSAGNDLPALPLEPAFDAAAAPSAADLMFALAPAAAAVQAQLRPAEPPAASPVPDSRPAAALPAIGAASVATSAPLPTLTATVTPDTSGGAAAALASPPVLAAQPSPSAEPASPAVQTQMADQPTPATPFSAVAATDDSALTYEPVDRFPDDSVKQPATDAPSFDDLLADDRRFERSFAHRLEPRNLAAAPQPSAVPPPYQAVAAATTTADVSAVAQSAAPRLELAKVTLPTSTSPDASGVAQSDWLPTAGTAGTTSHVAAPATQAAPGTPVDTRSPTWHEAFASRVQWLVDHNVGEAHIKLNPPELGAVDVKISLVDDKTFVQLTTATAAARDELNHSLPRLRELFTTSGLELGGASVQSGRDGQQSAYGQQGQGHGQNQGAGASEPRWLAPFSTAADSLPLGSLRPSRGGIDVFA